jgi:hypothetical protein
LEEFLDYREPYLRVVPLVVWAVDTEEEHWIAIWRNLIAINGRWERVKDTPSGWWVRAGWTVGRG